MFQSRLQISKVEKKPQLSLWQSVSIVIGISKLHHFSKCNLHASKFEDKKCCKRNPFRWEEQPHIKEALHSGYSRMHSNNLHSLRTYRQSKHLCQTCTLKLVLLEELCANLFCSNEEIQNGYSLFLSLSSTMYHLKVEFTHIQRRAITQIIVKRDRRNRHII